MESRHPQGLHLGHSRDQAEAMECNYLDMKDRILVAHNLDLQNQLSHHYRHLYYYRIHQVFLHNHQDRDFVCIYRPCSHRFFRSGLNIIPAGHPSESGIQRPVSSSSTDDIHLDSRHDDLEHIVHPHFERIHQDILHQQKHILVNQD